MLKNWDTLMQRAQERRHYLHQYPELRWEERDTADFIRQTLTELGITWRACANTGTVARIPASAKAASASELAGQHIAFRSDMDALPIEETSGVSYASLYPGKMHACGHDGHMAVLLAAAEWFQLHAAELSAPVSFIFQPAEEGGHGAKKMIEAGALEGVDVIYGWHNWPAMRLGQVACPTGTVMSGNATFQIRLQGRGGHASQPEAVRDPVLAAAALTLNLQQIVSRRLPPQVAAVLSVTSLDARSSQTIIPEDARLAGSLRFADSAWRTPIFEHIEAISQETAAAYGVEAVVETVPRYDATVNEADSAARYRQALTAEFGEPLDAGDVRLPLMASEDFSYYLKEIPGAFALLGIAENSAEGMRCAAPCHSSHYVFNDAVIERVVKTFSRIAGLPLPRNS